jgi:hypothetical protein
MNRLILLFMALIVSGLVAGCGSANSTSSTQAASSSSSSSASGTTGVSGGSGGSGTNGASGNGGSGGSGSGTSSGTTISDIQIASENWQSWGQLPPSYADCAAPCSGISWAINYGISSPSLSGTATKFSITPKMAYADVLFSAQLIGQNSSQIPDASHTLLPTLHNYVYSTDFYVTDAGVTQALEFDISTYMNGVGMIWGHECNYLGDGNWDVWDNVNSKWVSAGVPCRLINGWNHVTIQAQRGSDNSLLYESIEVNGTTSAINKTFPPGGCSPSWWGMTINYQMDGNVSQSANATYLDNLTLVYY